jgi:hypothetical protein
MEGAIADGWLDSFEGLGDEAQAAGYSMEGLGTAIGGVGDLIAEMQAAGDWNIGESIAAGCSTAGDALIGLMMTLG